MIYKNKTFLVIISYTNRHIFPSSNQPSLRHFNKNQINVRDQSLDNLLIYLVYVGFTTIFSIKPHAEILSVLVKI